MARRLSIQEEREVVEYMRDHPKVSIRAVARIFGRSRPTISDLRSRYALDRAQALPEVQAPQSGLPGGGAGGTPVAGENLFELTDEEFEILCARLGAKP